MDAGKRDDLIVIERKSVTTDDYGGEVETWATFCEEYVEVVYGSGREQREAAQLQGSLTATFKALQNPATLAVTNLDRIQHDGVIWGINAPPARKGRDEVWITATRG